MNKITHYGVFICLLFSIATEWNDIAKVKSAAIFCLLAALFYLLYIVLDLNESYLPDREVNRKSRFLQRRRARRNALAGLCLTILFVFLWAPHSKSLHIISVCCAFFFLVAHITSFTLSFYQEKSKEELIKKKEG